MPPAPPGPEPRPRRVTWTQATRIIASRYPPIDLFERVSADPAVWDALIAAEALVNPRVRDEVGEINLVPPAERVSGPGASYVMAAFTHRNPKGSRFSDGSYGVYYAARAFRTALRETAHHFARFASDSQDGPRYEDMRVLVGRIDARLHDVASLPPAERDRILDPGSYAASQTFGAALREAGSAGLTYPSVRDPAGQCAAAFRPKVVGIPVQTKHLKYHWDGRRVGRFFDYATESWHPVWP
jgi:RES domain